MRSSAMSLRAELAQFGNGNLSRSHNEGIGFQSDNAPFLSRSFTSKMKRPARPSIGSGSPKSARSKRGRKYAENKGAAPSQLGSIAETGPITIHCVEVRTYDNSGLLAWFAGTI